MQPNAMLAALFASLTLAHTANLANAQAADLRTMTPGTKVSGQFQLGNKIFVLPNGDWRLLAREDTQSTTRHAGLPIPMARAYLADIRDGRLYRAVFVNANVEQNPRAGRGGYWLDDPCRRSDVLFKIENNRSVVDLTCTLVNHLVFARTTTDPLSSQARNQMATYGASYPGTMISVQFTRIDPYYFMQIWYYFNPEVDGFAPSRDVTWASNDWHKDLIGQDARKVAFVEDLKKWSAAMIPWIEAGFEGKLHSSSAIPEPFAKSAATEERSASGTKSATSARLLQLKDLLDRGLITKDEYEHKRKSILDGL